MHTSRLSTFVIDCRTENIDSAAKFWAQALQRDARVPTEGGDRYRNLGTSRSEPVLMVQAVSHESRVHIDIETEDIAAEVARLEALGARRLESVQTWVVMEAPTGQRFCVVRPQRAPLPFEESPEHRQLATMVGRYRGRTKLWLDPAAPPEESDGELAVTAILGGRWLRLEEQGTAQGRPRAGEMLLGYHLDERRFELSWVDSFHTGTSLMLSHGPARQDGVIAVTGSYGAGAERWGWRTEFDARDELVVRAVNITPSGQEFPALETRWTRCEGRARSPR